MTYGHVKPGDPINLQSLREELDIDSSYALVKTERMEVIRMALPKGKTVEEQWRAQSQGEQNNHQIHDAP